MANRWSVVFLVFAASAALSASAKAQLRAEVKVDTSRTLTTIAPEAMGVGVAVWDEHMMDAGIPKLIRDAGFKIIRYPGGSYADLYQWKTHTSTKGMEANIQPGRGFDAFMGLCEKSGTTPLITVNYGSNPDGTGGADPAYAAEWVRYANRQKRYGVKYWEIGNEVYGNGYYNGQGWEVDLHAPEKGVRLKNPLLGPVAYGQNVAAFSDAMKAVDPSVKIGAVLTCPGGWPDSVEPDWNTNVLRECGTKIDFVVVHWYGDGRTARQLWDSQKRVPGYLSRLKALVPPGVQIWMTEGDASGFNMRHAGALFAANHYLTWWENGATHVDWWNLHNGLSVDNGMYDDQGILSSGHAKEGISQPRANTPFPPYYGTQLANRLAKPGDRLVATSCDQPLLVTHAALRKDGTIAVMLINQDPDREAVVKLSMNTPIWRRYDYAPGYAKIKESTLSGSQAIVPAYGITVLEIPKSK